MPTLEERLRRAQPEQLTRLLLLRPGLRPARTLPELAGLLRRFDLAQQAIADLDRAQRDVFEACCLLGAPPVDSPGSRPRPVEVAELAAVDPTADPARLAVLVQDLRDRWLLLPGGDLLEPVGQAAACVRQPLGLGRPVHECLEATPFVEVVEMLARYGGGRPRSGAAARLAVGEVLADTAGLAQALQDLPEPHRELLHRADAEGPVLRWPGVDPYQGLLPEDDVLVDLVLSGLLTAVGVARVELPREVGLAVRHPRLARLQLDPPALPARDVDPAAAGLQVAVLLDGVQALGDAVEARPPSVLASGGVGVREVRALAATAGLSAADTSTLLGLLHRLGLVHPGRKDLRTTARWPEWSRRSDADRWTDLARAWLGLADLPASRGSRPLKAALSPSWDPRAQASRAAVVAVLASRPGQALRTEDWLQAWEWRSPAERLRADLPRGQVPERELRADVLGEAALLGLLADDGPSALVAVLHDGVDPEQVLADLGTAGVSTVRAQADLTLVCTGRPSRHLREALDALAQVESTGAATVWRLSEQTLAPAFDDGRSAEDVVAQLESFAGTLPQAMSYLVHDAHRRHGRVVVGAAGSYVLVADDALLQDALRRRGPVGKRIAALGLRRVAPTVAVGTGRASDVIALLRELGLAAVVDAASAPVAAPAVPRAKGAAPRPLPALPLAAPVPDLTEQVRRLLG